jgi:hypothetical protein
MRQGSILAGDTDQNDPLFLVSQVDDGHDHRLLQRGLADGQEHDLAPIISLDYEKTDSHPLSSILGPVLARNLRRYLTKLAHFLDFQLFDRTFRFLCLSDVRPSGDTARESAFRQGLRQPNDP